MNCPTCNAQLSHALSYCSRCGANLGQVKTSTESKPLDSLAWALVATLILLLGMSLGAMVLMSDGKIPSGLGTAFVILCFFTLPVVVGLLVWRFIRLNREAKQLQASDVMDSALKEPETTPLRSLAEPLEPASSITETTTRNLEPTYKDKP